MPIAHRTALIFFILSYARQVQVSLPAWRRSHRPRLSVVNRPVGSLRRSGETFPRTLFLLMGQAVSYRSSAMALSRTAALVEMALPE